MDKFNVTIMNSQTKEVIRSYTNVSQEEATRIESENLSHINSVLVPSENPELSPANWVVLVVKANR